MQKVYGNGDLPKWGWVRNPVMEFTRRQNTNLRRHVDRNTFNDKTPGAMFDYPAERLGIHAMKFIMNILQSILSSLKFNATILRITYHRINPEGQGQDGSVYTPIPKGVHIKTLFLPVTNVDVGLPPKGCTNKYSDGTEFLFLRSKYSMIINSDVLYFIPPNNSMHNIKWFDCKFSVPCGNTDV